jgi:hypothetical protein
MAQHGAIAAREDGRDPTAETVEIGCPDRVYPTMHPVEAVVLEPVPDRVLSHARSHQMAPGDDAVPGCRHDEGVHGAGVMTFRSIGPVSPDTA